MSKTDNRELVRRYWVRETEKGPWDDRDCEFELVCIEGHETPKMFTLPKGASADFKDQSARSAWGKYRKLPNGSRRVEKDRVFETPEAAWDALYTTLVHRERMASKKHQESVRRVLRLREGAERTNYTPQLTKPEEEL